ncbi:hypothetical protein I4F81_009360 [Pyropia yezoensis]|uniref:Uncharacterized protein n=1 Tax=Pyropia yezoensis TaxID=2788 RepID=A0ACC3CAE3_PYRYE|nr:hypothetical protein I4F81_009360 [Neopyropia yezoensis]
MGLDCTTQIPRPAPCRLYALAPPHALALPPTRRGGEGVLRLSSPYGSSGVCRGGLRRCKPTVAGSWTDCHGGSRHRYFLSPPPRSGVAGSAWACGTSEGSPPGRAPPQPASMLESAPLSSACPAPPSSPPSGPAEGVKAGIRPLGCTEAPASVCVPTAAAGARDRRRSPFTAGLCRRHPAAIWAAVDGAPPLPWRAHLRRHSPPLGHPPTLSVHRLRRPLSGGLAVACGGAGDPAWAPPSRARHRVPPLCTMRAARSRSAPCRTAAAAAAMVGIAAVAAAAGVAVAVVGDPVAPPPLGDPPPADNSAATAARQAAAGGGGRPGHPLSLPAVRPLGGPLPRPAVPAVPAAPVHARPRRGARPVWPGRYGVGAAGQRDGRGGDRPVCRWHLCVAAQ